MATFTRNPNEATHRAEVIFRRDLSVRYGIDEFETDFEVTYFKGIPTKTQLKDMVPYGWQYLESHVNEVDEFDFDEESEDSLYWDDTEYSENELDLNMEELELEVV